MFVSLKATTGTEVDLNINEISCVIDKGEHYNVHVSSGLVISVSHQTYWDVLIPHMFPEE